MLCCADCRDVVVGCWRLLPLADGFIPSENPPVFSTFYLFAMAVAVGIPILLPLVPLAQIGRRFFILMSFVALVFVALAVGAHGLDLHPLYLVFAALLIAYNVLLPRQSGVDWSERREAQEGGPQTTTTWISQTLLYAAVAVGLVVLVIDAVDYPVALPMRFAAQPLLALSFLSAAFVVGGALTAMVLGHWYLVARKLSFGPLARVTLALIVLLAIRIAVVVAGVVSQAEFWQESIERVGLLGFLVQPGTFLLARTLFGLIAPVVMMWMVWRCVQVRSNQSATGILYVVVVFVFIGEIIAKYILVSYRVVI